MEQITDKLYSWASIIDDQALAQARVTAELDIVDPHVALMPDAHVGIGATVGSVIPTVDAVIPAAVGVDIGCGMVAVRTQFTADQLRNRSWWTGPELFVIIDDYDLVAGATNPIAQLIDYLAQGRDVGLHVVLTRRSGGAKARKGTNFSQLLRQVLTVARYFLPSSEDANASSSVCAASAEEAV